MRTARQVVEGPQPSTTASPGHTMEAQLRVIGYRLFASLFLYPSRERLAALQAAAEELLSSDIWGGYPFSASLGELLRHLVELDLEEDQPVINEYNRLYSIRPLAPPYETFYLDSEGQLRGMLVADLESIYLQAGLAISPELNELPDHVSVELEFMAFLCLQEAEAWRAGQDERARRYRSLQKSFMRQHLARWFPLFSRRAKEAAPRNLYSALLPAVFRFLRYDLEHEVLYDGVKRGPGPLFTPPLETS